MESGMSYRKRFLWQLPESELTAVQVAIRRRNLRNPVQDPGPLQRVFDPKRHTLLVHLTGPTSVGENNGAPIFDRQGVVCNKVATPDRTLEKERRAESVSSDDGAVVSPRICRKNDNPKCCRDLFLRDELLKEKSKHNNKNRSSKERVENTNSNKGYDSRPSTSGYNKKRTEHTRNISSRSRSSTPHSRRSTDISPKGHHTQDHRTEYKRKETQERIKASQHHHRSDNADQFASRSSHTARYRSKQSEEPAHADHQYHRQKSHKRPSRSRSRSTGTRSIRSVSRSRYQKTRAAANRKYRDRSRSKSTSTRSKSTKRTSYRSRSRSLTPLRPGEYRPGKRKRLSAESTDNDRRNQRNRPHQEMQPSIMQPFDYPPMHMPYHPYGDGSAIYAVPRGPVRLPRAPSMMAHPHHYAPVIQYVPVQAMAAPPHARGGHFYPQPPVRPLKVYNSRPIPQFQANVSAATIHSDTPTVNVTTDDSGAHIDIESTAIQSDDELEALSHENPTSTSITTPIRTENLSQEQQIVTDNDSLPQIEIINDNEEEHN